jgi:pyruvate kinase
VWDNRDVARTKIVATMGPAMSELSVVAAVIAAGADVLRVNCSHGTHEEHVASVRLAREAAASLGREVAVLADLQGPKIRAGTIMAPGRVMHPGDEVTLRAGVETTEDGAVPIVYPHFSDDVRAGDRVLLADGLIELVVDAVRGADVACAVVRGGTLTSHKGVNLPGVAVTAQSPTVKDLADLAPLVEAGVDYVALSFVRSAEDVQRLRAALASLGSRAAVVAKLERPEAITGLDQIVAVSDAVMVARGDLGVEMGPELVPGLQKRIIATANAHATPVITATEMLESMVSETRPTRAEASDVANAVFDGTSAVMLSAETAVGMHPANVVRYMDRICGHAEALPEFMASVREPAGEITPARAIARGVVQAVRDLGAVAVVVHTQTGSSSRLVAGVRPGVPILALTPDLATLRLVALHHGVEGRLVPPVTDSLALMAQANEHVLEAGLAHDGDQIIVVAGAPGTVGGTNRLLVHCVDSSLPPYDSNLRRRATD